MNYLIPKPSYPLAARLYAAAVAIGLAGLGVVAFETFRLFHGWFVALAFGLVIELGAVVESIGLASGVTKKTWWIVPGLLVTLLVSGGYNYLTAQRAGLQLVPQVTDPWILAALGVGPLSAVFFIAVQLGEKIQAHEAELVRWQADRQAWLDEQAARSERLKIEADERERAAALESQRLQLEGQERQAEADRRADLQRLELEAREKRLAERREKRWHVETSRKGDEVSISCSSPLVEVSRGTFDDFRSLLRSNGQHSWKNAELSRKFGVSTRTISTWRSRLDTSQSEMILENN